MHPNCRCRTAPYEDEEEYQKWLDSFDKETSGRSAGNGDNGSGTITRRVKKIDFSNVIAIMGLINQSKDYYKNRSNEYDVTITATGNVFLSKGLSGAVNPQIDEDRTGAYSYHNHPPEATNFSFSGEDIGDFIEKREAFMMASDYKYQYVIKRLKETKDITREDAISMFDKTKMAINEESWKNGVDPEVVDDILFDETVRRMSEELRFYYERDKNS